MKTLNNGRDLLHRIFRCYFTGKKDERLCRNYKYPFANKQIEEWIEFRKGYFNKDNIKDDFGPLMMFLRRLLYWIESFSSERYKKLVYETGEDWHCCHIISNFLKHTRTWSDKHYDLWVLHCLLSPSNTCREVVKSSTGDLKDQKRSHY